MRRTLPAFFLVFSLFSLSTAAGMCCTWSAWAAGRDPYRAWDTLVRAFHEVRERYVEEVDETDLLYAAMEGMVSRLDRHSHFLNPEAHRRLKNDERGRYFGIGTRITPHDLGIAIEAVFPDSPAALAGIQVGDIIQQIDDIDVTALPFSEAAEHLSGPRGEPVVLTIQRTDGTHTMHLVRDWVHVPAAWGERIEADMAVITLSHFQEGASREFRATISDLRDGAETPLAGLIIDLRDNPGGLLQEAVAIVDLFVGEQPIVSTRGRTPASVEEFRGHIDVDDLTFPVVILINGGSASGSEIVAGALRDLTRATLVGSPSYGKGSVQSLLAFEDDSALKLTISRYYLPNGEPIDSEAGLIPDVAVESNEQQQLGMLVDRLLQQVDTEADLSEGDRRRLAAALRDARKAPPTTRPEFDNTPLAERLDRDLPLRTAVDTLRAQLKAGQ